ncbi:MAG TPA: acyl-ACP--UDP-N-acetylglucosamine O-acyltransferase [Spirochaetota bacterium]|nr:acyl-ACP--UDP-N-acetylglucosamine O-acyltransferase [Spirochaetota bacterium]HNT11761.1 acyl-ACP--UDP-N-acetylglucosamine O-acyltransferase [Spirochaetota bacterium]
MIHNTAIIEGNVKLGQNVTVGPFAYIHGDVTIGDGTEIGPNVHIEGYVSIGQRNKIYHAAYLGAPPQDVAWKGGQSFVSVGDDNLIREFVQIHRGTKEGTTTTMGSNCMLMAGVHLAHNTKVGNEVIIANNTVLAGYVEVDDFCFVSGLVGFHQFVKIGKYCMISGMSRINMDCVPYMIHEGNPSRIAGINIVGLRRRGFSEERRRTIKNLYKLLVRSKLNTTQAVERIKAEYGNDPDGQEMLAFIERSDRGINK